MTVSIHQPNYLPWLGFFDKIKRSDKFVIFDNVQYPRGKGHFGNRNKIKIYNDSKWLTVPVEGKSEMKNFNEVLYSSEIVDKSIVGGDRILTILKELNATKYITGSGPGSMRYIKEEDFKEAGIELEWQDYTHPIYRQINGDFIPYMNVLDLLFNEGPNGIDRI